MRYPKDLQPGGQDGFPAPSCGNGYEPYLSAFVPGQEDGVWEETEAINRSAKISHLTGFAVSNTAIETEYYQCQIDEWRKVNGK